MVTRSHIVYFIGIALLSSAQMACSSKKNETPVRTQIVYMGDPTNMVKNTALNKSVDPQLFQEGEELALISMLQVMDLGMLQETSRKKTHKDVENKNRPRKKFEKPDSAEVFIVHQHEEGMRLAGRINGEMRNFFIRNQMTENGQVTEDYDDPSLKGHLLHFSQTPDKKISSFLFQFEKEGRKSLVGFWFSRGLEQGEPVQTEEPFNYILGQGVKVGWPLPSELVMEYSASASDLLKTAVQERVKEWSQEVSAKLNFRSQEVKEQLPFTDVNRRGVYVVEDQLATPDPHEAQFAVTISIVDPETYTIMDSDILIFRKEVDKAPFAAYPENLKKLIDYIVLHELGHVLGLHHLFDQNIPSIMSYSYNTTVLTDYDKAAVHALYR